ncbi:MAG: hypothetical protein GY835_19745 [bacterium]|nr:hypothetical protein [bacterium]
MVTVNPSVAAARAAADVLREHRRQVDAVARRRRPGAATGFGPWSCAADIRVAMAPQSGVPSPHADDLFALPRLPASPSTRRSRRERLLPGALMARVFGTGSWRLAKPNAAVPLPDSPPHLAASAPCSGAVCVGR